MRWKIMVGLLLSAHWRWRRFADGSNRGTLRLGNRRGGGRRENGCVVVAAPPPLQRCRNAAFLVTRSSSTPVRGAGGVTCGEGVRRR